MLTVWIAINDKIIECVRVVRRKPLKGLTSESRCTYDLFDMGHNFLGQQIIGHRFGDGAHKLAIKMLKRTDKGEFKWPSKTKKTGKRI